MSDTRGDGGQPFEFGCSTHIFPAEELAVLQARGNRLEALASGQVTPEGAAEKHFLRVHRGEAEPKTVEERAWLRLQGRRELEREEEGVRAARPKQDYGIIEWDQEKCWW
jgi:uncharacterized protein YifE (UPF0438 family)